ncbi:MAG TPA: flagellar M-ring protein FliF C-terminal domain-containing protein [Tepidisphaeraceae bacterium]|jgi:flagellar biosynthesis/type III secretory pathway M-ring protein FliF/YscJ
MDAIKQQLLKVQLQLAGLSASQKMLTASLLVIMVMTLFYWSHFASSSEMVAVIDKPLSDQELKDVLNAVSARGIRSETRNQRVFVPIGKKDEMELALSNMALDGKLPAAYDKAADEAEGPGNLLESPAVREQRAQERRRRRVETMISRWPDVQRAEVMIAGEKRIGILHPENPTASVSITMKEGGDVKKLAKSARALASRAQPGLKAEDISVIINGDVFKADDASNPFGGENAILQARGMHEQHFVKKILQQLPEFPGAKATVSIDLDTKTSFKTAVKYDPKNKAEAVLRQTTTTEETNQAAAAAEPGSTANVGVMGESAVGPTKTSSMEKTETTNQVGLGSETETIQSPAGNSVVKTAAVRLPESYFYRIWKSRNPKAQNDPTDADIQTLIDRVTPGIRASVKSATGLIDDKAVWVGAYLDEVPDTAPVAGAELAAIPVNSGFGAKEIAVGALAVISLFMVSMMVRKSAPQPVLAAPAAPVMTPPTEATTQFLRVADLAGEVAESTLTMTGQELSEEAIEAKQVIEQVGTMVKSNPDIAATLVKRWLNQD